MSKDDIALGMLALKHAMDRIKPAQDEMRRQARELWRKKERVPVEVDGEIVGTVGKSAPKPVAKVTDEVALREWMRKNYPESVIRVAFIEDMAAAIEVLEDVAPHLVHYRTQVAESTVRQLMDTAAKIGQPVGPGGEADVPGITVDTPDGNVTVLLDKQNGYLVEELFRAGRISLDGTVRKEIES